jgi:hypothetical protein
MKIKFEDNERHILSAFLFKMRKGIRDQKTQLEYYLNSEKIDQEEFDKQMNKNEGMMGRVKKLINKFCTPSVFVKLKRRDVHELSEVVSHVIEVHETEEVKEDEKPHLTEESYTICKAVLEKLEAGMQHSMRQDK